MILLQVDIIVIIDIIWYLAKIEQLQVPHGSEEAWTYPIWKLQFQKEKDPNHSISLPQILEGLHCLKNIVLSLDSS